MTNWYPDDVKSICKDCPITPEAAKLAKKTNKPVRNRNGECHCPCGTVTGCNLRGQMPPLVECRKCRELRKLYMENITGEK